MKKAKLQYEVKWILTRVSVIAEEMWYWRLKEKSSEIAGDNGKDATQLFRLGLGNEDQIRNLSAEDPCRGTVGMKVREIDKSWIEREIREFRGLAWALKSLYLEGYYV